MSLLSRVHTLLCACTALSSTSLALQVRSSDKLKILSLSASRFNRSVFHVKHFCKRPFVLFSPIPLHLLVFLLSFCLSILLTHLPPFALFPWLFSCCILPFPPFFSLWHSPPPVPSQPCCILFPCSLLPLDFDCLLLIHLFTPSSLLSLLLPILFCPFIHLCLINLHSPFVSSSSVLSLSFITSCLFLPLIFLFFPASSTESQLTHLATRTIHN